MPSFRAPSEQARHALEPKRAIGTPRHGEGRVDGMIHGLGTLNTYTDALAGVIAGLREFWPNTAAGGLADMTAELALSYLEMRAEEVSQSQLNKERRALQLVLGGRLPRIESEREVALKSRAYTPEQIELVAGAQTDELALTTRIAADAGLRAHELLTLLPIEEQPASPGRPWSMDTFSGRAEFKQFSVKGKGGLVRAVAISTRLAEQLGSVRLPAPHHVVDRKIFYEAHYSLPGGKQWGDSFTKAAQRALGWTAGAHGVRHSYAQERMRQLQLGGMDYRRALGIVSQELGHFRPGITLVYLR